MDVNEQESLLSKEEEEALLTVLGEKLAAIQTFLDKTRKTIQKESENVNKPYLIGLYNGLEMSKSVLTGRCPVFYEEEEKQNG